MQFFFIIDAQNSRRLIWLTKLRNETHFYEHIDLMKSTRKLERGKALNRDNECLYNLTAACLCLSVKVSLCVCARASDTRKRQTKGTIINLSEDLEKEILL